MIKHPIYWLKNASERPFGYFRLAGVFLVLVLTPLSWVHVAVSSDRARLLYVEGGVIETLSVIFWIGSLLSCIWALFHRYDRLDRLLFKWLCVICSLATVRELDAQVLLNPAHFGPYGVHYRIDWFFSNKFGVSNFLKLLWGIIFIVALALLFAPLVILRKPIMRLIRGGDTAAGLFLLGIVALATGFINDDILRGSHFLSFDLRIAIEETSEMLGSMFFFGGICSLLWKPAFQRAEPPIGHRETTGPSGK